MNAMHRLLLLGELCLLPFLTGCFPVPMGSEYPYGFDRSALDSLIGKDKRTILRTLHRPHEAYASETSSYFIYGATGTEYQVFLMAWVPIAGDAVPDGKLFCVLIEFDEENIFRRYQIERHSKSWSDKEVYDCALSFFTTEELETFTNSYEEIEAFEREEKERAHVSLFENNNELIQKAEQGDPSSQYKVFILMKGENIEPAAAWRWLCKAANQGYKEAQIEIGYWHNESSWEVAQSDRIAWLQKAGIHADNRVSYIWYTLAAKGDLDRLRIINNMFSGELSEEETSKAKDMVRNWKPGQCPTPYQKYD